MDILYADMSIKSLDGTVIPVNLNAPSVADFQGSGWTTAPVAFAESVPAEVDPTGMSGASTHYYLGDHFGTAQLEFASGGWPLWQGQFSPFGQELNNQPTTNKFKFTGKERDTESGLDYFGARYYASSMGRYMSPDWSAKAEPVPYSKLDNPQSLNLYGYVLNNPLSNFDTDGHEVVTLQLRSYIPQANVVSYRGDNRGPTASQQVTSRTSISITVETDPSISQNPLIGTPVSTAGQTQNLLTGNKETQTVGLPTATVTRDGNGNVVVGVHQNAANPLTPAGPTPGIQSNFTMTVPVKWKFGNDLGNCVRFASF